MLPVEFEYNIKEVVQIATLSHFCHHLGILLIDSILRRLYYRVINLAELELHSFLKFRYTFFNVFQLLLTEFAFLSFLVQRRDLASNVFHKVFNQLVANVIIELLEEGSNRDESKIVTDILQSLNL